MFYIIDSAGLNDTWKASNEKGRKTLKKEVISYENKEVIR